MVADLANDIAEVAPPPSGTVHESGETSRRRRKRGIVVDNPGLFWANGVVPYVFDADQSKLFSCLLSL